MCYDAIVSNADNPFSSGPIPPREPGPFSARVPEKVARGVYSPTQVVIDGPREFVIDFMQGLTRPYQVVARVIMPPATFNEFINALQLNLDHYVKNFGNPPPLPMPPNQPKLTPQEIYDHFKLPDELLSGSYSNQVLIGHSPTEFVFDFVTGFYPTPAVSSRVYVPAAVVPRLITILRGSAEQAKKKLDQQPPKQSEPNENPPADQSEFA